MNSFETQKFDETDRSGQETGASDQKPAPESGSSAQSSRDLGTHRIEQKAERSHSRGKGHLSSGHQLQGRYQIMEVLGFGGMSAVYKAQDLRFPKVVRVCVVKEMLNTATDPEVRAMIRRNFEREANILATLSHPGIVQVYDYFSESDRSYLVIEYVDGQDLEVLLNRTEGFLSEEKVVDWAIQTCEVLSYLHSHEPHPIVFRDIKPSNIMLDSHERIRVVDFGIARLFQSGKKGTMIGTEGYSPPEQYRGVAEPRVDIYALGATMHHLLSKQDPRLEPPFSFHERPIHETNPTVSRELVEVIDRALAYDVNKRYGSAEEMERALLNLKSAQRGRSRATTSLGVSQSTQGGNVMALWRFACEDEVRSKPTLSDGMLYVTAYDSNLYALRAEDGEFMWKYPTEGGIGSSPCISEGRVFFGSSDQILYAVNAKSGRIAWTCPTEGGIWSSPKAAFGHVFFGSDDQRLYAVNAQSGRVAWTFDADGKVRSSPAVGDEAIYVGCDAGIVYAIDTGGQAHWRFRARRAVTSSPAITKDMLFVGCQDWHVYCLDIRSGWSAWRYRTDGPIVSSPTVKKDMVFIGSSDKNVYALDTDSGRVIWRFATEGQVASSPAASDRAIYVGSTDGTIYSLNIRTGEVRWRFQTEGPVTSSAIVHGDVVYVGSDDHYVYALPA